VGATRAARERPEPMKVRGTSARGLLEERSLIYG